jgi:biotin carboxyl carrier protein
VGDREYDLTVMGRLAASEAHSMAEGVLETPMPGRVTRVAVIAGDPVKRGQELIVIEAMKMENALVAPMDGVVKSVAVKAGDMVAPGSALVVVEAGP